MAAEMRYVEVLLPLKLKNTLTYRLLAGQEAGVGSWVRVPLRGHPVLGVVTQLRDSAPSGVNLSLIGTVDDVLDKPQADTREIGFW